MEESLNSINAMKTMEVIDVNTGAKIGFIRDIKIDCEQHKILSVLLPGESKGWFAKPDDIEIMWDKIIKIGVDVILVDFDSKSFYTKEL